MRADTFMREFSKDYMGQNDEEKVSQKLTEMHTVSFSWFICFILNVWISIPVVCPAVVCSLGGWDSTESREDLIVLINMNYI